MLFEMLDITQDLFRAKGKTKPLRPGDAVASFEDKRTAAKGPCSLSLAISSHIVNLNTKSCSANLFSPICFK